MYSLFNPITIYTGENRVIFLGNNIPISRFFRLYYSDDEIANLKSSFDLLGVVQENEGNTLQYFSSIFNIPPEREKIIQKINDLFFDDWTTGLYQEYYGINNVSMRIVLDLILEKPEGISFIDIKYKRLVFIEYLLNPLFKSVTNNVNRIISKNIQMKYLDISIGEIVSYFFNELKKANRYDTVNGFSGILNLKANFKNPKGGNELPREVSNVHPSFKGKICPITVSNTNPGESITLVPEQNLKSLRYGIFDV